MEIAAYLLPAWLAILGVMALQNTPLTYWQRVRDAVAQQRRRIGIAVLILATVLISLPTILVRFCDMTTNEWKYALSTATGNWSADSFPPLQNAATTATTSTSSSVAEAATPKTNKSLSDDNRWWYAFSVNIAFWVNNLILFGLLGWIWRLELQRRSSMRLKTAFKMRDTDIEVIVTNAVASLVPNKDAKTIRTVVQASMDEATKHWETETLNAIYGPEQAERLRHKMKDLQIIP